MVPSPPPGRPIAERRMSIEEVAQLPTLLFTHPSSLAGNFFKDEVLSVNTIKIISPLGRARKTTSEHLCVLE